MSLLLCAIAEGDHPDPGDTPGPGGRPLRVIRGQGVAAIVAQAPESAPTVEELWEFTRVLERLGADGTVLPARYGTVLPDGAAVESILSAQRGLFAQRLAEVRGAVEFGLRARVRPPAQTQQDPPPADGPTSEQRPGTAYLLGRLATSRQEDELESQITAALGALTRDRSTRRDPTHGLAVACLVDTELVDAFLVAVDALREQLDAAVELSCTGPWPPFSFSGEKR